MSISSVQGISFKGETSQPQGITIKGKKTIDKKKVAIGVGVGVAAAAATLAAIYGIRTGKISKIQKKDKITQKATQEMTQELDNLRKSTKMSVADFKRVGKFDKGFASIDGKGYTGELLSKNGIKLTYENGLIKESRLPYNFSKEYSYLNDGTKIVTAEYYSDASRVDVAVRPNKTIDIIKDIDPTNISSYVSNSPNRIFNVKKVNADGIVSDVTVSRKMVPRKDGFYKYYSIFTDNITGKKRAKRPWVHPTIEPKPKNYTLHKAVLPSGEKGEAHFRGDEFIYGISRECLDSSGPKPTILEKLYRAEYKSGKEPCLIRKIYEYGGRYGNGNTEVIVDHLKDLKK